MASISVTQVQVAAISIRLVNEVPGPPMNVRFSTKRTSNMIKVRWDEPEDNPETVSCYELQMKHKKNDDWEFVTYSYKLSAKATGLNSNTKYYFRVFSRNEKGQGNFSETIKEKTRLGKKAVAALTPFVFAGGTVAAPFAGMLGGGALGGALGGVSGVLVADGIDSKAGAAAAGITTGVAAGVTGGVVGAVGGGVVGTLGAPIMGGVLARKFVKRGDSYSPQSSEDEDD